MKVSVEAYGCTMSMGEGESLRRKLCSAGHEIVGSDQADLVVINTCTVIQSTENRMLKRIRELSSLGKRVVAAGCLAVVGADRILNVDPNAIILPFDRYHDFTEIIRERFGSGGEKASPPRNTVGIVPIAQGCLGSCTYCITKLARGVLESRPPTEIQYDVIRAVREGGRELRVTAQDTARYGVDRGTDLGKLMHSLSDVSGDFKMRVGMMKPDSLSKILDGYLECWRSPKIFRFLHLPVQSGSDRVLEAMRRGYTVDEFLSIVDLFRSRYDDMALSTDVITGFPGETEEDHRRTVSLLMKVKPDIVNITRFSPRPGTEAFDMEDQVHGRIAKDRSREITDIRFKISSSRNMEHIGKVENVLITEKGKHNTMVGRTDSYRPVVVYSDVPLGASIRVEVVDAAPTHLFGKRL